MATEQRRKSVEAISQVALGVIAFGAMFGAAGTLRWPRGWLELVAVTGGLALHGRYVRAKNPVLREVRRRLGQGTQRWDLAWNPLFWLLMLSAPVSAGIEFRHLGTSLGLGWAALGLTLLAGALALSARAMAVNPFFEGSVRIQRDRGQRVIDLGPYARVRHPGYVGLCGWALSAPLLLGSTWACVPAVLTVGWVVLRTALEDALLRAQLDGYSDYARRVRSRLLPGLW